MWDWDLLVALQPPESLALFNKYMSQLSLWNLVFEKFMVSNSKDLTSRELQAAALLKIYYTTMKIMVGVRPETSDIGTLSEKVSANKFLNRLDDFQIVTNWSRPLIATAE
ncbi:hypothetical protein ACMFMG_000823 [Clarireedia jacksonii]